MENSIRQVQKKVLKIFARKSSSFALAGGTALELFYLHHRFSVDLDFFSTRYNIPEISKIILELKKDFKGVKLESELKILGKAKVRFYSIPIKGNRQLKLDFVEDVISKSPKISKFGGISIYSIEDIYFHKIVAITGMRQDEDQVGRKMMQGRRQSRDVFDIYMLSKKIKPLHIFMKKIPAVLQRGMVHWYRTFSRQDLKLALLDLDIYDKKFNAREMVIYLEKEIKTFISEAIE